MHKIYRTKGGVLIMNFREKDSLEYKMELQKALGYPRFKKRIARKLEENYNIEFEKALEMVKSEAIAPKIDIDIEWSQHMGADFWATEIYENFINKGQYVYN